MWKKILQAVCNSGPCHWGGHHYGCWGWQVVKPMILKFAALTLSTDNLKESRMFLFNLSLFFKPDDLGQSSIWNRFVATNRCDLTRSGMTIWNLCIYSIFSRADVDLAVSAARAAFKPGSAWRKMDASGRGTILRVLTIFPFSLSIFHPRPTAQHLGRVDGAGQAAAGRARHPWQWETSRFSCRGCGTEHQHFSVGVPFLMPYCD